MLVSAGDPRERTATTRQGEGSVGVGVTGVASGG